MQLLIIIKVSTQNFSNKKKDFLAESFRSQVQKLKNEISEVDNARIKRFMIYLNEIISDVYETHFVLMEKR